MKEILEHCQGDEEKGGIVIGGEFIALKNIAKDKANNFEFKLDNYNFDRIEAVVHSHIGDHPYLSKFDRIAQIETGLDWWVVANNQIHKYKCVDLLRGREFEYGKYDCGTLIEDAYSLCGINLKHYKRKSIEEDEANSVIIERLPKLGFYQVSEAQAGDVIATSMGGHPNHLALVLNNERILHHVAGQFSRVVAYGSVMQKRTHSIWRHKKWQPRMIEAIGYDLEASDEESHI
ncbi:C40 family peptidase [Wohlfahrtiimonas chitiniclastica]|uniref:NlpC/P60 family protein n=1 Tax=Wohlfahrtiimonas chitiniclastica TaxID=400946 RepID=UPI001BD01A9C|nr:NlpC/P60 family protein [Wohlfahrtiimonas chitiniclastica]MBS7829189.1 C40 family peptidase [Wohlfahrtiimonas chitiniclastica]